MSPGHGWRLALRRNWDFLALGAVLLFGLLVQIYDTNGVTSDGCIYFAQLRSLVFDGDLSIVPETLYLGLPERSHYVVALGPSVVWAPAYLAVALVDRLGVALGAWASAAPEHVGLTAAYVRAALITSLAVVAAGLFALHQRLRREFGRGVALIASVLLFGATPLFWYAVYEPAMTHAASFGVVALTLVAWERTVLGRDSARWTAAGVGLLLGLAMAIRPQNAVFFLFPVAGVLLPPDGLRAKPWQNRIAPLGWIVGGAIPVMILQGAAWATLLRRYPFDLVGESGYLDLLRPRLLDVLFSSWHGFLSWTPVAYVAVVGIVLYLARDRRWAAATLVVLLLTCWINGSTRDWGAGWSFGGRRFTATLAALAPGLAAAVAAARRRPLPVLGALAVVALVWNQLLMFQYDHHLLPRNEPVDFGAVAERQTELYFDLYDLYPFAFPANVLFSWQNDLPVGSYDLLAPVVPDRRFATDAGEAGDPYLVAGWGGPQEDDAGTFRPLLAGHRGVVAIPLRPPAEGEVALRLRLRSHTPGADEPLSALVQVRLNRTPLERLAVGPSPEDLVLDVHPRHWRDGLNRLDLEITGFTGPGSRDLDPRRRRRMGLDLYRIVAERR